MAKKFKVTVLVDGHIHQGEPVEKGTEIEVSKPVYDLFAKKKVLEAPLNGPAITGPAARN